MKYRSPGRARKARSDMFQGRRGVAIQGTLAPHSAARRGALQRKPGTAQPSLPAGVDAFPVNLQPRSGGWTLPREVQTGMEKALGADFSDVRIHVGPEVSAVGALAFTWGSNI